MNFYTMFINSVDKFQKFKSSVSKTWLSTCRNDIRLKKQQLYRGVYIFSVSREKRSPHGIQAL